MGSNGNASGLCSEGVSRDHGPDTDKLGVFMVYLSPYKKKRNLGVFVVYLSPSKKTNLEVFRSILARLRRQT